MNKKNSNINKAVLFFLAITLFLPGAFVYAQQIASDKPVSSSSEPSQHSPDVIIVKFKKDITDKMSLSTNQQGIVTTGLTSLDKLNEKYGAIKIVRLANNQKNDSFRFQKFDSQFSDIGQEQDLKKRLPNQQKNQTGFQNKQFNSVMKKNQVRNDNQKYNRKQESLYGVYKIIFKPGIKIKKALAEYKKDANLEYAELD